MSDQTNGQAPQDSSAQDPIQNLKGEFNRKIGGMSDQISALTNTTKELLSKLEGLSKPAPQAAASADVDDSTLLFERPKEFINKLREEVKQTVTQSIGSFADQATQSNQTLSALYDQYPELSNPNSELTKKVVENLSQMSKEDQRNPKMLKVAALEAAADLGVQPKRKRAAEEVSSDVSFGATRGMYTGEDTMPKSLRQAENSMMELAERMGVDVNNKDVKARLAGRLKRMAK